MSEEVKVKRFVLMVGHTYYASGGFNDYHGSFNTKEEAELAQKKWLEENYTLTWSHIVDLETSMLYGQGEGCNPMRFFRS